MDRDCACGRLVEHVFYRLPSGRPECWRCFYKRTHAIYSSPPATSTTVDSDEFVKAWYGQQ